MQTPPQKPAKPGLDPECIERLQRLADSEDFNREFVDSWRHLADARLKEAVAEAVKPAAERNAQAVVDAVREYSIYTSQINAVFATLADVAKVRKDKAEAEQKAGVAQKQALQPETPEA
jgi:hypothetical protein